MTDWITDRLPTEADADEDGDVCVCTSPQLNKELFDLENWHDVTLGWPWRHSDLWTPPTPAAPEPEQAARGFLAFTRVEYEDGFIDSAVGTDNTAWIRFCGINGSGEWMGITPLPQPGEE